MLISDSLKVIESELMGRFPSGSVVYADGRNQEMGHRYRVRDGQGNEAVLMVVDEILMDGDEATLRSLLDAALANGIVGITNISLG